MFAFLEKLKICCFPLGNPISDLTLTALSTSSVNVEVIQGDSLGRIKQWSVKNEAGSEKCSFNVDNRLKDCTDETATAGRNEYSVFGEWQDGSWGPKKAAIETLTENRTF